MQDRRYLNVPYKDKEKVKALGGLYDGSLRLWWVPLYVPLALVKKWIIKE